ncbi:MAG TPA: AmmeMemoRadiSam system protein B [Candidatus Brocadiia bacterium]|nr:AmmeMemoRadiSam system protein B [Candidatus Brocadiia bacterium]
MKEKRMERRAPAVAGAFYEASAEACRAHAEDLIAQAGGLPPDLPAPLGGVAPHAGWVFSGALAARTFAAMRAAQPQMFVLFGAVHRPASRRAQVYPGGAWATPLGDVEVDAEAVRLAEEAGLDVSADNHEEEHSIEVQLPLIQVLFPQARILPVAVPHGPGAAETGARLAQALAAWPGRWVGVASTDLTHYGMGYGGPDLGPYAQAREWMRGNDARFIRLVETLDAEAMVDEAAARGNACGAGAVAAAAAAARARGARRGVALQYATSADVYPEPRASRAVGYLSAVFVP